MNQIKSDNTSHCALVLSCYIRCSAKCTCGTSALLVPSCGACISTCIRAGIESTVPSFPFSTEYRWWKTKSNERQYQQDFLHWKSSWKSSWSSCHVVSLLYFIMIYIYIYIDLLCNKLYMVLLISLALSAG